MSYIYDPNSHCADEFINHQEILENIEVYSVIYERRV